MRKNLIIQIQVSIFSLYRVLFPVFFFELISNWIKNATFVTLLKIFTSTPYGAIYARKIKAHFKHGANFLLKMMHKISFFELSRNLFGSFIGAAFFYGLHFDNVNEKSIM